MSVLRKYAVITPVNVAITCLVAGSAFLVSAGSQSKVSQCHQLISVINQGSSLIDQKKGKDAATTNKLARDLEKVTQNLTVVYLGDTNLQGFQNRFIKVFQTLSQAFTKAGKALDSARLAESTPAGRVKVDSAKAELEAAFKAAAPAAKQADGLAAEINHYCNSNPK